MKVRNIHSRVYSASPEDVAGMIDTLSSEKDLLWPGRLWPRMAFDKPLSVGASGGHGPIRYIVEKYSPGKRVKFRFTGPNGFNGYHAYELRNAGPNRAELVHTLEMQATGVALLTWPLVFRPLHDALIEDSLSFAEQNLNIVPETKRWSPWVKLLRWLLSGGKSRAQAVPRIHSRQPHSEVLKTYVTSKRENYKAKRFWDKIASRYDKQALRKYQTAYGETIEISRKYLRSNDRVLDFACGTGITTIELAPSVQQIMAIDLSDKMIRLAKDKATFNGIDNITFKAATIEDTDLKNASFDVITAFNILHGLEDVERSLTRIWTLLKAGGIFLSVTDCLGEKRTMTSILYAVLSKMGFIPKVSSFKRTDLVRMITSKGFTVIEEKNLYPSPPNYYLAARKTGS